MHKNIIIYGLVCIIFLSAILSCSSEKDIEQRKNLMMPKKSEMPPNSRYKEPEKKKTYKPKKKKSKNKKLF